MQLTWTERWADRLAPLDRADSAAAIRTRPLTGIVLVAALVPYLDVLSADFTFDDVGLIRDNAAVQLLPAAWLLTYVYEPGGLYRPLTMLTYAANAAVSPGPFGFHLLNCVLHALVSVTVLLLALRIFAAGPSAATGGWTAWAATSAAVLFAVHPIHTEAVTNVVGRAELLAALGVLASLLACARSLDCSGAARAGWALASLAAYFAAMLAKESALTGLGLLAVLHWWLRRDAPRRHALALLPYAGVAAAYLALRYAVLGTLGLRELPPALDNPLAYVDAWTRLRTAAVVLGEYGSQLLIPAHLSADYSFGQIPLAGSWTDPIFLTAAALLAAAAVATLAATRRRHVLVVAALFTVIPLAATANVAFPIGTIKAERLLYLPSVGCCLGLGWLAAAAMARRNAWAVLVALVVLTFAVRTWARNRDWRDDQTLFAATALDAPNSAKAHYNFAVALQRAGVLSAAKDEYGEALRIYPPYAAAAYGLGSLHGRRGDQESAVQWYETALRLDAHLTRAHRQLAALRKARQEYDSAEAACRSGLAGDPTDLVLLAQLSAVRVAQGDRWEARATLDRLDRLGTIDARERAEIAALRAAVEADLQ